MPKSLLSVRLRIGDTDPNPIASESDEESLEKGYEVAKRAQGRRSELLNGLTRRQRTFILEKLLGHTDKDAALLAGYSLSVAENTKQRIWKPRTRVEFERLKEVIRGSA